MAKTIEEFADELYEKYAKRYPNVYRIKPDSTMMGRPFYLPDVLDPEQIIGLEKAGYRWYTGSYIAGCTCTNKDCPHKVPTKQTVLYHAEHWAPAYSKDESDYTFAQLPFKAITKKAKQYAEDNQE